MFPSGNHSQHLGQSLIVSHDFHYQVITESLTTFIPVISYRIRILSVSLAPYLVVYGAVQANEVAGSNPLS